MAKKLYVLNVVSGVEPCLVGPYKTVKTRDAKAKKLRNADDDDSVFYLNVSDTGDVEVGAYSAGFMEGITGFDGSES